MSMIAELIEKAKAPDLTDRLGVVLRNIRWETYEMLLDDMEGQRAFLVYDRGTLEIMSPILPMHERPGRFLEALIREYTLEKNIPICSLGSTTWKQRAVKGGLEADCCFYFENEALVRNQDRIDLDEFPPPELAIESEVTRFVTDKMGVYARLRIPEVWRVHKGKVAIDVLNAQGTYDSVNASRALTGLTRDILQRFLEMRARTGDTQCVLAFRDWLQSGK